MLVPRLRLLLVTLWVGSLWTIGYLVAPTLFATLDNRTLAGAIAGKLFRIEAWLTVACSLLLIASWLHGGPKSERGAGKAVVWLAAGMLACTLIGYFGLQPFMGALRESAQGGVMSEEARKQFGMLHGVSSVFYLIQSILGIGLVLKHR